MASNHNFGRREKRLTPPSVGAVFQLQQSRPCAEVRMCTMTPIRVVAFEEWTQQSVQPAAGTYCLKGNRIIKVFFGAGVVTLVLTFVARAVHPVPSWMVWCRYPR